MLFFISKDASSFFDFKINQTERAAILLDKKENKWFKFTSIPFGYITQTPDKNGEILLRVQNDGAKYKKEVYQKNGQIYLLKQIETLTRLNTKLGKKTVTNINGNIHHRQEQIVHLKQGC